MFRYSALLPFLIPTLASAAGGARESWVVATDLWGNTLYQALELERGGNRLTGTLDDDRLDGEIVDHKFRFVVTDSEQATYAFTGDESGETLRGTADFPDTNHPEARVTHAFEARRVPLRPEGPPRRHELQPTDWSNEFSSRRKPVLTIWPGDSVHTTTIDSGGVDEKGKTRALFGNPQTGPFYVATAGVGDTLVIRIDRLRLNRDYADSLDDLVSRAIGPGLASKAADLGRPVRWKLDRVRGMASLENPPDRLAKFEVPVRPMLGGLAVAPGFGSPPISTGDTGRFGGNMDWNEIVEGVTVYLPVNQPGALLYLGDAHALQGDGETSQWALETSMDVEFSVDVLQGRSISGPRVESAGQIMALGQAGSLDDALRAATAGLTQWLEEDYGLNLSESAQVLGSSVHYVVVNLAGRSVGVAAKLDKRLLGGLRPIRK
ncbi:MAG TPA: acetamidase/formamidase family protein [Thermoanaerobaculia bacterium]|nr:acetamidase/formamidase family protein [Thermoanaerobaculia bacterium]